MREVPSGLVCDLANVGFDEAIERVTAALKVEGFGVLTSINIRDTFAAKLGVDFRRYVILGACNPTLAHRGLSAEPQMGLLLPCNVVVQEAPEHPETIVVSIGDPRAIFTLVDNPAVAPLADEVEQKLRRVLAALPRGR